MVTYIYFVKCPNCEDEHFDFFDEAKEYAMGCLSQKPVITQTEVCRNDFGECTDSCDLGTVWSWEDMMGVLDQEETKFSKAETFGISEGVDDFDDFDIGPQSDEFADIDDSVDFEIEDGEFADEDFDDIFIASEPVTESVETKYWMCFYDGNDVGVVEAADEDEAMEAFMDSHNTLRFDSWDHDWSVEEISEEEYDEYEGGSYGGYEYDNEFDYKVDQAIDAMNRGLHEESKRVPVSENASILDATLPAKDTDYVIAVRSQRVGSYTFLSMSYKLTPNLDRAMTYSSAYEAEHDIKYALDEAQRRGDIVNSYDTDRVFVTTVGKAKAFPGRYDLKALQQHNPTAEACERKPVPEGMTVEQLKETMEENEDMVECAGCEELFPKDECFYKEGIGYLCGDCEDRIVKCTWCEELYDKGECRYEVDLGWLCDRCEAAIKSRGETLTFREGNYWDFLDESVDETKTLAVIVKDSINHLTNDLGKDPWAADFVDDVIKDIENNYDVDVPNNPKQYSFFCDAVAKEVSFQLNKSEDDADFDDVFNLEF